MVVYIFVMDCSTSMNAPRFRRIRGDWCDKDFARTRAAGIRVAAAVPALPIRYVCPASHADHVLDLQRLRRCPEETQGKCTVLATTAAETQAKGSVRAAKAAETQGKGSVRATRAAETQGIGSVRARKGSGNTGHRQCLTPR